jgi:hypothetical protein
MSVMIAVYRSRRLKERVSLRSFELFLTKIWDMPDERFWEVVVHQTDKLPIG